MEWLDGNKIQIIPPKRPKKLTGTRFATILGLNPWSTPFEIWCEVTRTYQKPFEDTIYTIADKTIEPKQAEYMKQTYFMSNLVTPTDIWGKDYFRQTYGDFFKKSPVLGGMWDYLLYGKDGKPTAVLEMKTSKRVEDWKDDIPEYYALQAALYAYLLGVDDVIMVCTILGDKDYDHPENFTVTQDNTFERSFKVSERYPNMAKTIKKVEAWWKKHVEGGVSPKYDEKKDADILKVLRANSLSPDSDLDALVAEAEQLQDKLNKVAEETAADEKRLKTLKDLIKEACMGKFRDGDKQVIIQGSRFEWVTSRSTSLKVDEAAMKKDGVLDKYKTKETVTYKLTPKERKE